MSVDDPPPFPFTAGLLYWLSQGYGAALKARTERFRKSTGTVRKLPCRVVSVGNITAGGTGKTPMTLYLAQHLAGLGFKVVIASRGYRGRAERCGGIVSDGRQVLMTPAEAGDEPFMMATALPGIPVLVGRDRYVSGLAAVERFGAEILILDDAFQHLRLARDVDIVLLDAARPLGNGHLLPRGTLREPARALTRAHALVLTRVDDRAQGRGLPCGGRYRKPLFHSRHLPWGCWVPDGRPMAAADVSQALADDPQLLAGRRVLAFSGIAANNDFRRTVKRLGALEAGFVAHADHHAYSWEDCRGLCRKAQLMGADALATTFKDYVKLTRFDLDDGWSDLGSDWWDL